MAKITKELVESLAKAVLEAALDKYDEYFYSHISEVAEDENIDAELLEEKVSDYIGKLLK